jgi:L-threonylcarbamoyladenylate synthase
VGLESTILDLSGAEPRILRPGMLDAKCLGQVLGRTPRLAARSEGPRASGRLASHYAPATPLELVDPASLKSRLSAAPARIAVLTVGNRTADSTSAAAIRPMPDDPEAYARVLYARLRELDLAGFELILVERPPGEPAWAAIHDRLQRAAAGREVYDG